MKHSHQLITKQTILFLMIATVLGLCGCNNPTEFSLPPQTDKKTQIPNVFLIIIDTLRPDYMGLYNSESALTPNIDLLAQQAYVFEQAYATSAWTRSSIASIFTSRYPTSIAVLDRDDVISERIDTVAEIISKTGNYYSFGISTNPNTSEEIGFGQGFTHYSRPEPKMLRGYPNEDMKMIPAEAVTKYAITLMSNSPAEPAKQLFGFLHYMDPHDPYLPHPGLLPTPEPSGRYSGSRTDLKNIRKGLFGPMTKVDIDRLQYLYSGEIKYADYWVGKFIDELKRKNIFESSLIMIVSDHGEEFWEHGNQGHGWSLYEAEIHVPFVLKLPQMQIGEGKRVSRPVSLIDIAPTILDVLNIPPHSDFQGQSLLPYLADIKSQNNIFSELHMDGRDQSALIKDGMKTIKIYRQYPREFSSQLFDLQEDPRERTNLYQKEITIGKHLDSMLNSWEKKVAQDATNRETKPREQLKPETLRDLKGLGYIK